MSSVLNLIPFVFLAISLGMIIHELVVAKNIDTETYAIVVGYGVYHECNSDNNLQTVIQLCDEEGNTTGERFEMTFRTNSMPYATDTIYTCYYDSKNPQRTVRLKNRINFRMLGSGIFFLMMSMIFVVAASRTRF